LQDFQRHVATFGNPCLILPDSFRTSLLAVHEMRVLAKQLLDGVAGQLNERLVGEDDRIAGQRRVHNDHRHAGDTNGLHEHTTMLPNVLNVAFSQVPLSCIRYVDLEVVHTQP
jgi:uncharacterized protein with von Willebrand factor type A (vWA) domain